MAARVLAAGDDTSNCSSRRLIVLALLMSKINRQNLRQKKYVYTRGSAAKRLPSLEGKNKLFVGKKRKKRLANSS